MPPSELRLLGHNKVACFITWIVSVPENLVISSHKCGGYPEHPYECHYSIEWTSLLLNPKIDRGPPMIPAVTVEITSNVVNAFRSEPPPAPSFVIDCGRLRNNSTTSTQSRPAPQEVYPDAAKSGFPTYLSAEAVRRNGEEDRSYQCELVAIEPYPNETLKAGFPGLSSLIPKEVQEVPLTEVMKLTANNILFIDSSHVLKIGNDVQYEYLSILPRLNKGVIIHVHDIFLPAEYPKEWVLQERRFWTEQYLLQAFLAFNESFEVLWAGSYMHLNHSGKLEASFSSYNRSKTLPGSFWIRRTE